MSTIEQNELQKILTEHKKWLKTNGKEGSRANLIDADLRNADLRGADLRNANLRDANLRNADLNWTTTEGLKGQQIIAIQIDTSRPSNVITYWKDLDIVTTGCFQGTLEELEERVEITHKDNELLRDRYHKVIEFFKSVL